MGVANSKTIRMVNRHNKKSGSNRSHQSGQHSYIHNTILRKVRFENDSVVHLRKTLSKVI